MHNKLYTIGHSTHSAEHFISLLVEHGVTAVCDVRSTPYSRMNPQFNRETLKVSLKGNGVAYVFLGQELGARSDNPACYVDDKVQYDALANEPLFAEGLKRVRQGMERYVVALMCAEKDPLTCHRTILVCRALKSPSISIFHISGDGALESHTAAEKRLMQTLGIKPDMFQDEETCIEDAYKQQAARIAYVRKPQSTAVGQ